MCPEECAAVNRAFGALPNAEDVACCDCGEGPFARECTMRKMKIGAACGFGDIECDGTMKNVGCASLNMEVLPINCFRVPLPVELSSRPTP